MNCSWPENLPSDRRKAMEELVRGREIARRLMLVIDRSIGDDGSSAVEDLVAQILDSFANSLAILKRVDSDEVLQFPASGKAGSLCWDGRKSEESGEISKSSSLMNRRGCHKKRKNYPYSWIRESPNPIEDSHAWRKYGQKVILNAKYPRNYFRCTHKFDKGCQATKQVQRVEEDPPKYRTTYYEHHTCMNLLNSPPKNKQQNPFSTSFPSIKQEYCYTNIAIIDDMPNDDDHHHHLNNNNNNNNHQSYSSSDYHDMILSPFTLDHGDVIISGVFSSSRTTTPTSATTYSFDEDTSIMEFDDNVLEFF